MEGGAPSAAAGFIFFLASSSFSNFSFCVVLEKQKMYFESKCYVRKMGRYVKYTAFVNSFFLFLLNKKKTTCTLFLLMGQIPLVESTGHKVHLLSHYQSLYVFYLYPDHLLSFLHFWLVMANPLL